MRLVLQRVARAEVTVAGATVAAISSGIMALVGFGRADGADFVASPVCRSLLEKVCDLRIFPDEADKLNRSLRDTGGSLLLVSQFTLYAACRKGRRPSFASAAPSELAAGLFRDFVRLAESVLPGRVATGVFGADMDVSLVNRGPVTIVLDSRDFVSARSS